MRNALVLLFIVTGSCGLTGCQSVYDILAPTFTVIDAFTGGYDDQCSSDDYGPSSDDIRNHRRELSDP